MRPSACALPQRNLPCLSIPPTFLFNRLKVAHNVIENKRLTKKTMTKNTKSQQYRFIQEMLNNHKRRIKITKFWHESAFQKRKVFTTWQNIVRQQAKGASLGMELQSSDMIPEKVLLHVLILRSRQLQGKSS